MQDDALGPKKALAGGVADQRMLEEVGCIRRLSAAKHQHGFHQSTHGVGKLSLVSFLSAARCSGGFRCR
jgi:hypothetical protein